ncbi:MAG: FtsX-like permease family protein [Candidatus Aminicenantes bacterium]|nr:FtsX-like permease family protein [Candidatus Aminicenantes bacterium]
MLKNYLKIALRNIKKHKGYSFINIAGLAVGMTCCLLILLWVHDELSYDRYHEKADRIYRITFAEEIGGAYDHYAVPPFAAAPVFEAEVPEIVAYTRLWQRTGLITYNDKKFDEQGIFYVDKDFFKIFTHQFIEGEPATALAAPGSVVLTHSMAKKIFGEESSLGKTVNLTVDGDLKVTGVVEDVPRNSHFRFNYLVSMDTLQGRRAELLDYWLAIIGWSYILLDERADSKVVEKKLAPIVDKHAGAEAQQYGTKMFYFLQPLTDIHLKSHLQDEIEGNGDIRYVYVFSIIAVFILLIACINFMNLSTARSANRGKEVGLRKILGAYKKRLVVQFITESAGFSFLALVLAVNLVWILLPAFNNLTGKEITITSLITWIVVLGMFGLVAFTGIAAGSYPAFYLSSFQPIDTLRKKMQRGSQRSIIRTFLVIFQFTISIILIASTFIVLKQLSFMKNQKLGFKKEQTLAVRIKGQGFPMNQGEAFKNELKRNVNIIEASYANGFPGRIGMILTMFLEGQPDNVSHTFDFIFSDYDFLKTYEIDLVKGRDFSREFGVDREGAYLINETAAAKLGWGEETVGKKIGYSRELMRPIVGIVKDFHYKSLKQVIGPLAIYLTPRYDAYLSLKMNTDDVSATLSYIEKTWNAFEKERSFEYFFVDENFDSLYHSEEQLSQVITYFALVAIFVACLGLFGLASYTAEQSTKEIGIRKVLGASVGSIVLQLSRNFLKWVLVANVIAWPVTYIVMKNYWLSNFPFRIQFSLLMFIVAGMIALAIALLTVSYQSIKAAVANPADSLRYE